MSSRSAIEVLKHSLKLTYDDHVSCLLRIPEPYLDSLRPDRSLPIQDMLNRYNADIAAEFSRFGEQIQADVTGVLENVNGTPGAPSREDVMAVVDQFVHSDLYKKRFSAFTQAIERHMRGFGVHFDLSEHRVDIPESLCAVNANNGCRTIRSRIANSIDKLYLQDDQSTQSQDRARGPYATINRIYHEHQILFWGIAVAISAALALMTL